jgi:hypothetical protein
MNADPDPQHCFNQYTRCLFLVKNHLVTLSSMVLAFYVIMDRATVYYVELLTIVYVLQLCSANISLFLALSSSFVFLVSPVFM